MCGGYIETFQVVTAFLPSSGRWKQLMECSLEMISQSQALKMLQQETGIKMGTENPPLLTVVAQHTLC